MNTITVTLAGKKYTVKTLPIRQAKAFRGRFGVVFETITVALRNAPAMELGDLQSMAGLVESVSELLVNSIDQALDLVCEYAPEIAADRERIETEGYDEEVIQVFVEVLKLLYPLHQLRALMSGPAARAT
jgi:hypothetical protein